MACRKRLNTMNFLEEPFASGHPTGGRGGIATVAYTAARSGAIRWDAAVLSKIVGQCRSSLCRDSTIADSLCPAANGGGVPILLDQVTGSAWRSPAVVGSTD